jgi:hypothetical protein
MALVGAVLFSCSSPAGERAAPLGAQSSGHWHSIGPFDYTASNLPDHVWSFRAQGRVSAAWGDARPGLRDHWLFGFSGGGIWETWNAGQQWRPLTDDQPTLDIGSIAVDATGRVIYAGTGEQTYIFTHAAPFGSVVLKSTDAGQSWTAQTVPWPDFVPVSHRAMGKLAIDPDDARRVWAATTAGLMRTDDGGATWSLAQSAGLPHNDLAGCSPRVTTDATDVAIAAGALYVAIGRPFADARCTPSYAARAGNGIYRSVDGGATFTRIAAMGDGPFAALGCSQGFGRIVLAPGPGAALYALIGRAGGEGCGPPGFLGVFRTLDASAPAPVWTLQGTNDTLCGQFGGACSFRMTGVVAPDDVDLLFLGGFELWRSTDGGAHMEMIGMGSPLDQGQLDLGIAKVHSDHHALVIPVPGLVLDGTDGGVWTIEGDRGPLVIADRNGGRLSTMMFYGLAQHPTDPDVMTGGAQDFIQPTTFDGRHWLDPTCGGNEVSTPLWNRSDPDIVYSTFALGGIWQSTDGGRSYGVCTDPFALGPTPSLLNFGGCTPDDGVRSCVPDGAAEILAPAALDPNNQDVLFEASKYVYALEHPSPSHLDWTRYCAAGSGAACPDDAPALTSGDDGEDISAIAISPAGGAACNGGTTSCGWLTGSNEGALFRTADGGASWLRVDQRDLGVTPPRAVLAFVTHPADHGRILVGYGGFDADARFTGEATGHLFRSLDGGATWLDVGAGLPDAPVAALAIDPDDASTVYVGTWLGAFRVRDAWGAAPTVENAASGLPSAMVFAMGFSPANGRLRVATHGRGIWELRGD